MPTRHSDATSSIWCLADYRAVSGSDLLADPTAGGLIRSIITTPTFHLPTTKPWVEMSGRPRCRWIDQIRKDNDNISPADL